MYNNGYNQPSFRNSSRIHQELPKITLKPNNLTSSIHKYFENYKRDKLLIQSSLIEKELTNQIHSQNQQNKFLNVNVKQKNKAQFVNTQNIATHKKNFYCGFNPINSNQIQEKSNYFNGNANKKLSKSLMPKSFNQRSSSITSSKSLSHEREAVSRSLMNFFEESFEEEVEQMLDQESMKNQKKYIMFLQNNFSLPYQEVMKEYFRLQKGLNYFRLWTHNIIFFTRLKKATKIYYQRIQKKLKEIKSYLLISKDQNELQLIKNNWIESVIDNVKKFLNSHKFTSPFKNNKQLTQAQFQQLKNQLTIILATKLISSLVDMIRKDLFPDEILKLSQLQILHVQQNCPLFVAQRISRKILRPEQTLIISGYIIFDLLIDNLIKTSNCIQYLNLRHQAECKFQIITLCTLLQNLFMKQFKKLKLHGLYDKISQRKLLVNGKTHHLQIVEVKEIDETEVIISGLQNQDYLNSLIKSELAWYKELLRMFQNFIKELELQSEI